MVAVQPFRQAEGLDWFRPGPTPPGKRFDTVNMSVKEVRGLLASLEKPDIPLLCQLTRDPRVTIRNMAYRKLGSSRSLAANEDLFREEGVKMIAGADEAGRGALAGPLVAAAVMFEPDVAIKGVNDSKLLTPGRRDELYVKILDKATSVSVVSIDATLIDKWGLQMVNLKALADALAGIEPACDRAICDHFTLTGLPFRTFGIPHGDQIFHCVAAASIVAKVERDRVMRSMHLRFPRYRFEDNKGYGTEEHLEALDEFGPCEIHRLSFSSVSRDAEEVPLWEPEDES
jgi:ribonuclease HII